MAGEFNSDAPKDLLRTRAFPATGIVSQVAKNHGPSETSWDGPSGASPPADSFQGDTSFLGIAEGLQTVMRRD